MVKLSTILCSISSSSLGSLVMDSMRNVIIGNFSKCYGITPNEVQVSFTDGTAATWDIIIAYDQLPSVPDAMTSQLNCFRDLVADGLFRVIPASVGYGGRVTVRDINRINFSKAKVATSKGTAAEEDNEDAYDEMASQFQAVQPKFTFDQLVLAPDVEERLLEAISVLQNREKLFDEWNLKAIMSPSVLLNLYGDTGTGKSMTAEALASKLGKKIIRTTYADIESKYHGEGPKRLKALFLAAKKQDAVLFIDEADSMLSARLTSVNDGSAQAINSMRSQLLISLENHDGIVIFATNLIENYDKAFLTRLICLELKRPTKEARRDIWYNHLYPKGNGEKTLRIPLAENIDLDVLSDYDFCGRDIRNAVKQACISTVVKNKACVDQEELVQACERTKQELEDVKKATEKNRTLKTSTMTKDETKKLAEKVAEKISNQQNED